jgi:hypothetical protein
VNIDLKQDPQTARATHPVRTAISPERIAATTDVTIDVMTDATTVLKEITEMADLAVVPHSRAASPRADVSRVRAADTRL